eukprot:CAMPEP_0177427216 /NCGR_PEP_ID=MMETSP0368-20130122/73945_1 /TAXON_ID=447022 ORGANISM="Scrippsiella hangoei-like, Strain SHHI-4" /NCGR_SAMPLE_ID=MMETSP0368 /ASSEMBLY_ACC=CAM_ASM_000363 /LENGTH=570 /DNA_ID=CAMNT_0018897609 /DNA_START=10 /DNA_END=1723 /DNA_ORIENTATION=-
MPDKEKAAEYKAKGNTAFAAKDFEDAIQHFTAAIEHDNTDHVFFSNRSACYASLAEYDKALEDGSECVKLKPDWAKGYTRKGLAEYFLRKYDDAVDTYKAGLKLAPEDPTLKEGLQKATDAKYEVPGAGVTTAAAKNPKIKEYMKDPNLMQQVTMMMQLGQSNPAMQQQMLMQAMQQDPRILEVIMAMQGIDVSTMGPDGDIEGAARDAAEGRPPARAPPKKEEPKKEEPPDNRTPAQKEADDFKNQGNELYKKKQFKEALEMYDKAIEKEPNDLTYINNKSAVLIEMGPEHYDIALAALRDVIERRYEINTANPGGASFEKVAKVFNRIASIFEKRKDFEAAIGMYHKALTEDNNRQTRNALRELERAKEKHEKESYLDPAKAEEHKQKGNEFFKGNKYADAKTEYDEAIKRNPTDAKLYSNRAATLTKLMAHPDALKDIEECLRLDPTFVKAYSRKGATHFFMKEYHKALQAYDKGLAIEPDNEECKRGKEQVVMKISETNRGEVDEEQIRHAMADPEIQQIMHDPQIKMFLQTLQENPKEAQKAMMSDSKLMDAVNKLHAAGIIRTG